MRKRETCLWIFPVRWAVFMTSFLVLTVSTSLMAATFLYRNPMMIHLAIIHQILPWVYIVILAATSMVGICGLLAATSGTHGFMVFYKVMFWFMTFFFVYLWQIILFVLAIVNREKTTEACMKANPIQQQQQMNSTQEDTNMTIEGYTSTILGLNSGETFGLATCDQAVEAGITGIAVLLFLGSISMTWFAVINGRCARSFEKYSFDSHTRNAHWDDNLDQLQSAYARDRKYAPTYPLKDMNTNTSKFSRGLIKLKLKKNTVFY